MPNGKIPVEGRPRIFETYYDKLIFGSFSRFFALEIGNILDNFRDKIENVKFLESHRKLYQDRPFSDVTFKLENQEIFAHKGFLVSRCPYFEKIFADRKGRCYT